MDVAGQGGESRSVFVGSPRYASFLVETQPRVAGVVDSQSVVMPPAPPATQGGSPVTERVLEAMRDYAAKSDAWKRRVSDLADAETRVAEAKAALVAATTAEQEANTALQAAGGAADEAWSAWKKDASPPQ